MEKYRYTVNNIPVTPYFNDDMSLVYEKESGYNFFRSKLSGSVSFLGFDFDLLASQDLETEFVFKIERYYEETKKWEQYFVGKFYKTDGKWNYNDKKVTVSITPKDAYDDILAGLDKEFSLVKITNQKSEVSYDERGVIQIYIAGSDYISNIQEGICFEQKTKTQISEHKKLLDLGFKAEDIFSEMSVIGGNGFTADYLGLYSSIGTSTYKNALKTTYVQLVYYPNGDWGTVGNKDNEDNKSHYKCIIRNQQDDSIVAVLKAYSDSGQFISDPHSLHHNPSISGYLTKKQTYSRILSNNAKVGSITTISISNEDIVETGYKRIATPYATLFGIQDNFECSSLANQYGKYPDSDFYYSKPESSNVKVYQTCRSNWGCGSIWLITNFDESSAKSSRTIKDCYLLSSVINSLLKELGSDIVYYQTKEYSQFFYSDNNPITNTKNYILLFTHITNVLTNYDTAATKTPITLGEFLKLLKVCYDCDWFVENGKLRIEHSEFFKRGGKYNNADNLIDLTQMIYAKNNKSWAYAANGIEYDKVQMPERYKFKWHDEVSPVFNGYEMEVQSKFVSRGKVEEFNAGNFTSDIDYSMVSPEEISKDGYMLLGAEKNNENYVLPYVLINNGHEKLNTQNGYLSFAYLQSNFLTFNMPSKNITINGMTREANGTLYGRTSTVKFPVVAGLTTTSRIKTSIGIGIVEKFSVNLCSDMVNATIKYDTYE